MVFKSDRQRKGFFASRGNVKSNVTPLMMSENRVRNIRFDRLRRAGFTIKQSNQISKSKTDTRLALSIAKKAKI